MATKAKKKVTATKTTTSKATAKKVVTRGTTAKKVAPKKVVAKKTAAKTATKTVVTKKPKLVVSSAFTKTQIVTHISDTTGHTKKEVTEFMEILTEIIEKHVSTKKVGEFTFPGLLKMVVSRKPSTKARKGINHFTGEEIMFKAKPARNVVKIKPLKKLKDMV